MLERLIRNILGLFGAIFKKSFKITKKSLRLMYDGVCKLLFIKRRFTAKENFIESIKTIFVALVFALLIRSFLFEPFHIPSSSMRPNLLVGDYIFVSKYSYGYSRYSFPFGFPIFKGRILEKKPKRGDVVVFRLPQNPRINYIKRLIGFPGDKIQMIKGVLYINGKKVPKKYLSKYKSNTHNQDVREYVEILPNGKRHITLDTELNGSGDDTFLFIVPKDHYFFLGDNRDNSLDSRFVEGAGFVPAENLVGKAQIIFLSSRENPLKFWKWFSIIRVKRTFIKIN